ncbi:Lcl C-terminal domain-containing protein [Paralcaligenes ginsengisoli]
MTLITPTQSEIILPCAPGEFCAEEGGSLAGIMRGDTGLLYCLFTSDIETEIASVEWGGYGKKEAIANSKWDGLANTRELVASKIAHPAAEQIAALTINGHSDWYLAAQRESALCWANVPHLFKGAWYLTSTQYSPDDAWIQTFGYGNQLITGKGSTCRARAVRRSIIQ